MDNANQVDTSETTQRSSRTEHAQLQQRIAELEQQLVAKEAQCNQLCRSEAHYRAVYEMIPTMMHSTDQNGCLLNVSDDWLSTLGYERHEVIGRHATEFLTEESRQNVNDVVLPAFWSNGICRNVAYQMVQKSGECIDVLLSAVTERDEDGAVVRAIAVMTDITERTYIEDELQKSRQNLSEAQRILRIGIWDMTFPNNELRWSDEVYRIFGLAPQEFGATYEAFMNLVHPDDRDMLQAVIDAALQEDAPYDMRHRIILPSGKVRVVHERGEVIRDDEGIPTRMIGTVQDVTELKKVEDELHENQERLQFILEGSNDGGWDTNMVTGEVVFSDQYGALLGYEPGELAGSFKVWQDLIHADDAAEVNRVLQDYLDGKCTDYVVEHRLEHKSGAWRWFLGRGKVVARDEQGNPTRMTGTITDIHERKRTEDALRTFKAVVDNASDAITIVQAREKIITYYNEAYRQQYRCGDSHLGQPMSVAVAPEGHAQIPGVLQEILEQGVWKGQLLHIRQDGTTFPALESCFSIKDNKGNVEAMVAIVRDITELVQAEEERATLQQQIIDAQKTALFELSTPLLPLANNVVALPLIGTVDSQRAQQVMETLLEGIAVHQAEIAIVDITGVKVVDTQVAQAIIRTAQAVKLLGAQVILTGIQPQIAQTLVHLGTDLSGIVTRSTLQNGISYALGRSNEQNGHHKS